MTLHDALLVLLWTAAPVGIAGWIAALVSVWLEEEAAPPGPPPAVPVRPLPAPVLDDAERIRRRDWGREIPAAAAPRHRIAPDIAAHFARRERGEP